MTLKLAFVGLCLGAAALAAPAFAQDPPAAAPSTAPAPPAPPYGRLVTLAEAKRVVEVAQAEAVRNGWTMVFTVVEPNGAVVLTQKMDGAQYGALDVALGKAVTAARFRRPTKTMADGVKAGNLNPIFTNATAIDGGELLIVKGEIIGALGVSGALAAMDGQVARVGAAALN